MKPIKIIAMEILLVQCIFGVAVGDDLSTQMQITRSACSGISDAMSTLKKMAGINTAVTAVGTVAGGVALGTGIAKTGVDSEIEQLEKQIEELKRTSADVPVETLTIENKTAFDTQVSEFVRTYTAEIQKKEDELSAAEQKSKTLGHVRTGTLATTAVADTAGTIIAAKNQVDEDLQSRIENCATQVQRLQSVKTAAQVDKSADSAIITQANTIIRECREWEYVNLTDINKKAKGAAISGGTGAVLAIVGTITSASANSDSTRQNDDKEKSLNTTSNVLAGGATGASAVATIFNATQIGTIKKALNIAEKCEGALL